jgi:hypothetical protein
VLSSVVATLAMTVGLLAFTSGAASAEPRAHHNGFHNHYPMSPPVLVVNKGVVKYGATVKASGRKYAKNEKVHITIYFKAKGSKKIKVVKIATVRADKNGKFVVNIKMSRPGTVLISATGKSSHKTALAAVYVIDKKKGAGGWIIRPVAHTTALASTEQDTTSGGAGMAAAGLGVLGLAGSAALTRQAIRRRRGSAAA